MQITLNKIAFDVQAVDRDLRAAILKDPVVARGALRPVWAWDAAKAEGRYLVPTSGPDSLPLPTGLLAFVTKPGTNGAGPQKADGPTQKMGERLLAAVGAKGFGQVVQALSRVVGVPVKTLPLDAFAMLRDRDHAILMATEFQVVEIANAARNLSAYLVLPGLVSFVATAEPAGGAVLEGPPRQVTVIPPGTQAGQAMRRLAVARRLTEMQAELGGVRPADLPADDPRRPVLARLGAEWKALQAIKARAA